MASINKARPINKRRTHEGASAAHLTVVQQLERSVMSCLLWENEFYEDGQTIADRIRTLVLQNHPADVVRIARQARQEMHLRHVPLLIVDTMLTSDKHRPFVRELIPEVVKRADEMAELLAMYWADGGGDRRKSKRKMCKQLQRGLADVFPTFSGYEIAKYNRDKVVTLRDVMFLCHPKPSNPLMAKMQELLAANNVESPDTWEVALSAGADKRETFTRLIKEDKLGGLALLRNLRNMQEAKVPDSLIRYAITTMKTDRILPFRFIAAARYGMQFEPELEQAMFRSISGSPKLKGTTLLLVDVSGSMDQPLSAKSDMHRIDAACGLAMILREVCETFMVASFSYHLEAVPPRRGFALRDAIVNSQQHGGTDLGGAVDGARDVICDRLIVVSDEQSHTRVDAVKGKKCVMINVASAENGVGYGDWLRINGWSDAVVKYLVATEQ